MTCHAATNLSNCRRLLAGPALRYFPHKLPMSMQIVHFHELTSCHRNLLAGRKLEKMLHDCFSVNAAEGLSSPPSTVIQSGQ